MPNVKVIVNVNLIKAFFPSYIQLIFVTDTVCEKYRVIRYMTVV